MARENNIAFIDGQNLHLGITSANWKFDLKKFRVFLRDKYHIEEAYYFLGYVTEGEDYFYNALQKAGFIVSFREHSSVLKWKKKGNVDVDIVFEAMRKIVEKEAFDKIVLVSGDGDYIKLVKYLIEKQLLRKILFPNGKYSSLYNPIRAYGVNLSLPDIREKIEYTKKEVS